LNAITSKSAAAKWFSTEKSGTPAARMADSMSIQGAYVRSASASARSFSSS
jgi:hypothetical protein